MALWQITVATAMLIVVVAVAARLLSLRAKSKDQPDREWHLRSNPYHAVSIRYGRGACEAAKQLAGKHFLSKEAPPLPLPECTTLKCHCRYAHHEDRRVGEDRRSGLRSPFAMGGIAGLEGVGGGRTSFRLKCFQTLDAAPIYDDADLARRGTTVQQTRMTPFPAADILQLRPSIIVVLIENECTPGSQIHRTSSR